jgi:hypothetical protein
VGLCLTIWFFDPLGVPRDFARLEP